MQSLSTFNISEDQRPNKRKYSKFERHDDILILYNIKLNATNRQIIKNGELKLIDSLIDNENNSDPPQLLERLTQVHENVLVYKRGADIYVRKTPWKKDSGNNEIYVFLGFITDVNPLPCFLTETVTIDIKIKTHNLNCVYGKSAHLFF